MKDKPTNKQKRVKGFAVIVDGKLDTANNDGWGLGLLAQMAEADNHEVHVVPCTITYTLPTRKQKKK
jgi:hypothetical protein